MKNNTLLIAIPYFYPKRGGLENYAYNIARGLRDAGWRIVVAASNHERSERTVEEIEGMRIYRLPALVKLSNTPVHPFWYGELLEIIKKERPAVVNGHTPVPFMADAAALAAKASGIPFVLTYQNDLEKGSLLLTAVLFFYSLVLRWSTLPAARRIIVTTPYFQEKSKTLQPFADRVAIIPPGVAKPLLPSGGMPPLEVRDALPADSFKIRAKRVLFVGSMDKSHIHKGLNVLIDAVAAAKKIVPEIQLIAAGKGDGISEYKKHAEAAGIANDVIFTGFVSDEDLRDLYRGCDVVVLPSINNSEGFGMVLIEAGAHGKPVIGTRVGGIPYVIDERKTGLLVQPGDSTGLAGALVEILTNDVFARKLGEAGRRKVLEGYLWEHQVEKTRKLLEQV